MFNLGFWAGDWVIGDVGGWVRRGGTVQGWTGERASGRDRAGAVITRQSARARRSHPIDAACRPGYPSRLGFRQEPRSALFEG